MSLMQKYHCNRCGHTAEAPEGAPPSCCGAAMTPEGSGEQASYSEAVCSPEFPEGCKLTDE